MDTTYEQQCTALEDLYAQYRAEDICLALEVSELWLPNTASQAKHCYALGVFIAMDPARFKAGTPIDSYSAFRDFLELVHALLPTFPMLEDFVPELDWGEVRVQSGGQQLKILYGSVLERVPDFIEAFRLAEGNNVAAMSDLHTSLLIQDFLTSHIDRAVIGNAADIASGHIEIPSEPFWEQCRAALLAIQARISELTAMSPALVLHLGTFKRPETWSSFGDAVMSGTALPATLASIGDRLIPIWVRNLPGAVIDYWAQRSTAAPVTVNRRLIEAIADFLSQRFYRRDLVPGPFRLVTHSRKLPYLFSAALLAEHTFQLFITIDEDSLDELVKIERDLRQLTGGVEEWAVMRDGEVGATQFRRKVGGLPGFKDLVVVAILSRVASGPGVIRLPKTEQRVLSLPDFVTILDSVKDPDELQQFWSFIDDNGPRVGLLSGAADLYAAFRDSHALLVEGAVVPSMIWLDPHWGTSWRYKQQVEFWSKAPLLFPDDRPAAWTSDTPTDGMQRLEARDAPIMSWCTRVGSCVLHFLFDAGDDSLDQNSGRIQELLVHCLADAVAHRLQEVSGLPIFDRPRIVTRFRADARGLTEDDADGGNDAPLLSHWHCSVDSHSGSVDAVATANLHRVRTRLEVATDAAFEAECVLAWIEGVGASLGLETDPEAITRLESTASRLPRFTVKAFEREIDVPDYVDPVVPSSEHYKLARRDLAVTLKELGAKPGDYQLGEAKAIIDPARDAFRASLHARIASFDRASLLRFCVEQIDAITTEYRQEVIRTRQSLEHEVSYDRTARIADAHRKFVHESRNYRYLLECCVSRSVCGSTTATDALVVNLLASTDWLQVLYIASDVLHNDLDVAGLTLDHLYVPQVVYSEDRQGQEQAFLADMAKSQLGLGLDSEDEVSAPEEGGDWSRLDEAFRQDVGVSFTRFQQAMTVLSRWQAVRGEADLRLSYQATRDELIAGMCTGFVDMTPSEAKGAIAMATLDPAKIKRLLGKTIDESDVPVWEHNKRGHRYTIRPLIALDDTRYIWGAAAAERTAYIWRNAILNGYLPADYPWPHIAEAVRAIKKGLEQQLEVKAKEVVARATPFVAGGINFKTRFPAEGFEDVGDYDVLAFWPALNRWLSIECKYNQPPFCLKDARRLRDRIFGVGSDHGQFSKIERRRGFLTANLNRLHALLGWPEPESGLTPAITELYVSRNIYWWMMNPPYVVPTQFVRVDGLDFWLRDCGFTT